MSRQSVIIHKIGTSPSQDTIALEAQRFDATSGATTVNGGIPLKPGQLTSAQIGNVSIWEGGTELPITVTALQGYHSDNSLRAIQVKADINLGSAETKSLTLRLDQAPTAGSASSLTIDKAWMLAPTLLYCVDATHMCLSRITMLPLIPLSDAAVPSAWYTHLTTDFQAAYDEADAANSSGNDAEYDWPYEAQCHYLATGDETWLVRAMTGYINDPTTWYNHTRLVSYWIPNDSPEAWNPTGNPEGLTASAGGATGVEQYTRVLGACLLYYLTGWEMARRHAWCMGTWCWGIMDNETTAPIYGPRFFCQWRAMPSVVSYFMRNPTQIYVGNWTAPDTQAVQANSFIGVNDDMMDLLDAEADAFSDWRAGIWGFWDEFTDGAYPPAFQFSVVASYILLYYYTMNNDSRVPDAIKAIADGIIYACGNTETATYNGYDVYWMSYLWSDPDLSPSKISPVLMMMYKLTMTFCYAYTSNTAYRDWADQIADLDHNLYDLATWNDITWKEVGQTFYMSHHACAYRSGVAYNGWWTG